MSHVDEGALHAYLDGALDEYPAAEARRVREHLATCSVCAERLSEERRVRDDARTVLDLAAPTVDVPTFEELRAYVQAGQSQRRALGRLYKMGWAASVVLALGTGWFLRGGPMDPVRTFEAESGSTSTSSARAVEEVDAPADQLAPEPALQEVSREAPAAVVEAPPTAPAVADYAPPPVPLERAAAAPPTAGAGARAEVAQAPSAPSPAAGPPPERVVVTDPPVVDDRALDDAQAGGVAAFGGAAAGLADQQADAARVQQRLDSAARATETRRRIAADQVVTSSLDAAAPAAPTLQRQAANEVEQDEASPSLVVPGLPVLDVMPVSEGTAFAGVRALQRLESGDTLEVFHLPEGIDPTLLAPAAPETSQLVRPTPEGWLVLRAPLTMLELEQLLERLQAGR